MRSIVVGSVLLAMGASTAQAKPLPKVLFVTHSGGFRHQVVTRSPDGSLAFAEKQLQAAARDRFDVVATQDLGELSREKLKDYKAVVFYTTGELPIDVEALTDFVKGGGGFAGIHSATDTLYKSAAYGELIGGYFDGHPWHEKVRIKVEDPKHPATAHLGPSFEIADEIYQFKDWDRKKVHVLLSLDDASVDLTRQGVKRADHDFANAWTLRAAPPARPAAATGEEDFTWLLQAAAVPPGWKQAGPGGFKLDNGVATAYGGMGLWYYAPTPYKDFVLRLQYRQAKPSANSGVFVRFPRVDGDPMIPVNEGYEIQIYSDQPSKNSTGAIYSFQAPIAVPQKPAGE